jgi:hypothetical protein
MILDKMLVVGGLIAQWTLMSTIQAFTNAGLAEIMTAYRHEAVGDVIDTHRADEKVVQTIRLTEIQKINNRSYYQKNLKTKQKIEFE